MGSWDVSCSLTGVHIGVGDKAVIVPLRMKDTTYDNELDKMRLFGNTNILSNGGCNVYFEEATYPIFGEYADYGGMDEIIKDDNTAILEEYFGLTIDQIVCVLTDNRKSEIFYQSDMADSSSVLDMSNPKHAELVTYSITWIHGDVYSKLAKIASTEDGRRESIDIGTPTLLKELGFTFEGKDNKRERYNQKYKKGKLTLWGDGTWVNHGKEGVYSLKDLAKIAEEKGVELDITEADSKNYYEQLYDYKLKSSIKEGLEYREMQRETLEFIKGDKSETADKLREAYSKRPLTIFNLMGHTAPYLLLHKDYRFECSPNPKRLREHYDEHMKRTVSWNSTAKKNLKATNKKVYACIDALEKAEQPPQIAELYGEKVAETDGLLRSNITEWFTVKSYFYTLGRFLFPIGTSPQWGDSTSLKTVLTAAMEVCDAEIAEQKEFGEEEGELADV